MAVINLKDRSNHQVNDDLALKIKEQWKNNTRGVVDLGNISFNFSKIDSIYIDTDNGTKKKNDERFEAHRQERLRFLYKQAEEKADQILNSQAILFYKCHNQRVYKDHGRYWIDSKIREMLRGDLIIFFKDPINERRCYADREIFEEYLEKPLTPMNANEYGAYKAWIKNIWLDREIQTKSKEKPAYDFCNKCLDSPCKCWKPELTI